VIGRPVKERRHRQRRQSGAVLLIVLLFVLVSTLGASSLVQIQQTQSQREREEQLLFVGDQYRRAISSYYNTIPPGGARALPKSIDNLLEDKRFPVPRQHLRRAYLDPMTGQADWILISGLGGIVGVRSRSEVAPIKRGGFDARYKRFEAANTYSEWQFSISVNF
jgi:type II secretory pathway pseudopilin PulG